MELPPQLRLVIIESPYSGKIERNMDYARQCMKDSLKRGEMPFASHLLYTQVLDDTNPEERAQGIASGLAWGAKAEATIVYHDYGITPGMYEGIRRAAEERRPVLYRHLLTETTPEWLAWNEERRKLAESARATYRDTIPPQRNYNGSTE